MESTEAPLRLRLILGKYRVIACETTALEVTFTLDMGNSVKITISTPPYADIHVGDLLTLYTEVLTHANPQQSSVQ